MDRIKNNGELDGEDAALWAHVTRDVTPIEGREAPIPPQPSMTPMVSKPKNAAKTASVRASTPTQTVTQSTDNQGLDTRTKQKLERGQMEIEATLDLHGHTQIEAHQALNQFLMAAHNTGKRCVLVITGKGNFSKTAEKGILKRRFSEWIAEEPLKPIILHHAPAKNHGGGGAFYVLLRRKRSFSPS